jgi:DNA mismatch repair protein MutS
MEHFSLLWPPGTLTDAQSQRNELEPGTLRDLGIDYLLKGFSYEPDQQKAVRQVLVSLISDPRVIRYRQDVLTELLEKPSLAEKLQALLPVIESLVRFSYRVGKEMSTLHEVTWRVGELLGIVQCVAGLSSILEGGIRLKSEGLLLLQQKAAELEASEDMQRLKQELPAIAAELRSCESVTIGINLDHLLRPVEATLLSVNENKFTGQSLLARLFGSQAGENEGIAPLHEVPRREAPGPYPFEVDPELGRSTEPLMVPLFEDLSAVLEKTTRPIARRLKKYAEVKGYLFSQLRQDLYFYLGALTFIKRLRGHGLPVCRPEIARPDQKVLEASSACSANLALAMSKGDPQVNLTGRIVSNPILFGSQGRVLILTGPNQGGKTTYIQTCGVIQLLAQAGLYVPAESARFSPVDNIYTHFSMEERLENQLGRFGDEARRLAEIFQKATSQSMIFLNETFSSTNTGESLYLAQDVVRILRRMGVRAIYSTHMHELAGDAGRINQETPGESLVGSLVSSPVEEENSGQPELRRSYRIEQRPPMGRSYATEIAARYGISYLQLEKTLLERGILQEDK